MRTPGRIWMAMVSLLPVLALLAWGAGYLWSCVLAVGRIGGPLDVLIPTEGGPVRLRADRFEVESGPLRIRAVGVSLQAPGGGRIARADRVEVQIGTVITVRAAGLEGTLERLANGSWRYAELLPKPTKEPSTRPFSVSLASGRVLFIDHTAKQPWARHVALKDVNVDGVGDRWLATGNADVEGSGPVDGLVRHDPEAGLDVSIRTKGFEAAPALNQLARAKERRLYPDLATLRAGSLRVDGVAQVSVPVHGSPTLRGTLHLKGRDLAVRDVRVGSATFEGTVTESGAVGTLVSEGPPVSGSLAGSVLWSEQPVLAARVSVSAANVASLPPALRKELPHDLAFSRGTYDGWLSYSPGSGVIAQGDLQADSARWGGETVSQPAIHLRAGRASLAAQISRGRWMGGALQGSVLIDLRARRLSGLFTTRETSLAALSVRLGRREVRGFGNFRALLGGTLDAPVADVRGAATGTLALKGVKPVALGNVDFAARYAGGKVGIQRLAIAGPNGVLAATGWFDVRRNSLSLEAIGNGLAIEAVDEKVGGMGLFKGRVWGPLKALRAEGRVGAVGVKVGSVTVPFAAATLTWSPDLLAARDGLASKGASLATGSFAWKPSNGALAGEFSAPGVILSDWLGPDAAGAVSIENGRLSGTVGSPVVAGDVKGRTVVVAGIRFDDLAAKASLTNKVVSVPSVRLKSGSGEALVKGAYDLGRGTGTFEGTATDLSIAHIFARLPSNVELQGTFSGAFAGGLEGGGLASASASGSVHNVALNGGFLGSGRWAVAATGPKWSGSVDVGQVDAFLDVPSFEYDMDTHHGSVTLSAYSLALQSLYGAARRYLPEPPSDLAAALNSLTGTLSGNLHARGSFDDDGLKLAAIEVSKTAVALKDFGAFTLDAKRNLDSSGKGYTWDVAKLGWDDPEGALVASGTVAEDGDTHVGGELTGLRFSRLALWWPELANFAGRLRYLSFEVDGPTRSPKVTASLQASNAAKSGDPETATVNLESIVFQEGLATASGLYTFAGFTGKIDASAPFGYPLRVAPEGGLHVGIDVAKRSVVELIPDDKIVDRSQVSGVVQGRIDLNGRPGDLLATGHVTISAPRIPIKGWPFEWRDVEVTGDLDGTAASVALQATSSLGGNVKSMLSAEKLNVLDILQATTENLLAMPVKGEAVFQDLNLEGNIEGGGKLAFRTNGKLALDGPARRPVISGNLDFSRFVGAAPSEFALGAGAATYSINPQFKTVALSLARGSRLRASVSEFVVGGTGSISGSLSNPVVDAALAVEGGAIKLPNAPIRLEPGGRMVFSYKSNRFGTTAPRLDVDLSGATSVTAMRFGDTVQRYQVNIHMTGNALADGQLQFDTQSDPPDLTHDEVMAILGQGDFLKGLAQGSEQALASYALPIVFAPITQRIASRLGLDFLSLDYDLYERATITAARTLGGGFTLYASRQVNDTTGGRPLYELKLGYRLPFRSETLRSFSFGLGTDQIRPWKVTLEYGKRFTTLGRAAGPGSVLRLFDGGK